MVEDYDKNRLDNESPSVDKPANMEDNGELKDLVEEVKEDNPTEQPKFQITPDNEYTVPDSLDPRLVKKEEKENKEEEQN